MLHIFLVVVGIWMLVSIIFTLPLAPVTLRRLLAASPMSVGVIGALTAMRLGYYRGASLIYLASVWVQATMSTSAMGGIRSSALIFYGTLPVSAAWLLGHHAALWTAGVCISSMLVFAVLEMNGMAPRYIPRGTPLGLWFAAATATLLGAIPVGHVIRRLLETLKELERYKRHLELLVDQRTAELVKARDEAQAANRAKSTFLANMSHELRTPLNAILGFSNLLRESGASEQQRRDLDIINRSGKHLLGLINDVLDVAKIEAGRTGLEIAPFELGSLIQDVMDMVRPRAAEKGLALRVETAQLPLFVRIDAARLRQVLINLLSNAVKFTEHGSVSLRVNAVPAAESGEVLLTFEIEDTGEGIAAGDLPAIFDAFVQPNTAKRHEGVGLGLTISRRIMELMGGTIQVESTPGQGSRFWTQITVERAQASELHQGPDLDGVTALAEGQPECRVLIVEDQQENWMVLQRLLENAGFRVRVAEDGAQGVKQFRKWRPQFIWMDLRMPVMDGIEAARRIRKCEGGREVKIAAVTASGYASERSEVLAEGLDDYVRKPYRPAEIFECMARHLGVRYQVSRPPAKPGGEEAGELTPEDLSSLPHDLRNELRDALIALDPARISAVIERISQENTALGLVLARYADRYGYTKIFDAIRTQESETAVRENVKAP
jgi:signal transduction histidine kinase/DNA-binding response OmpR family regulator